MLAFRATAPEQPPAFIAETNRRAPEQFIINECVWIFCNRGVSVCCLGSAALVRSLPSNPLLRRKRGIQTTDPSVIATPCPLCQQNVEMHQDAVNKKSGTDYNIPVVFYSQLMAVAFGMDADKDACLDRNTIRSGKLEKMAKKG